MVGQEYILLKVEPNSVESVPYNSDLNRAKVKLLTSKEALRSQKWNSCVPRNGRSGKSSNFNTKIFSSAHKSSGSLRRNGGSV